MKRILGWGAGLLLAASLEAQVNINAASAPAVMWGQKTTSTVSTSSQFWFKVQTTAGRSYCVETGVLEGADPTTGIFGDRIADTVVEVFRSDATTLVASNDDAAEEPFGNRLSRTCWVETQPGPPGAQFLDLIRLRPFGVQTSTNVTLRFSETTLFCPWFFVAGDYNAFSLIRNTSVTQLPGVVITWRGLTGAQAGTTTVTIPANGTVILNARDFVNPAVFSNGSIEIAHPGSPEQIQASTTTLSGTTGLGFDAVFGQRNAW